MGFPSQEKNHILVQRFRKYFIFKEILLSPEIPPYFLLILKNSPNFNVEDFDALSNLLQEILYT